MENGMESESESEVAQSCLTLCDPVDYSPPGSSVHGILQARILEWVAISFSRESSCPAIEPRSISIQSTKTRPGADCGSDHELLITKFRLKLKKARKTATPFRYDLNQIPYDYTVEVRNRSDR